MTLPDSPLLWCGSDPRTGACSTTPDTTDIKKLRKVGGGVSLINIFSQSRAEVCFYFLQSEISIWIRLIRRIRTPNWEMSASVCRESADTRLYGSIKNASTFDKPHPVIFLLKFDLSPLRCKLLMMESTLSSERKFFFGFLKPRRGS